MNRLIAPTILLLLAGCATAGNKADPAVVSTFEDGVTRCTDIVAKLGKPWVRRARVDGGEFIRYDYAVATARPESYIPVAGFLVGGSDTHSWKTDFVCNADGVLVQHLSFESDRYIPSKTNITK